MFHTRSWLVGGVLLATSLSASSCSLALKATGDQCSEDKHCVDKFGSGTCVDGLCVAADVVAGPWACKDSVEWVAEDQSTSVEAQFRVITLLGQQPFEGLTLFACPPFDPNCANPITQADSDAAGDIFITVNVGFRGHFFAPPPASFPDMAPTIVHLFPPPAPGGDIPEGNINLTTLDEMSQIAELAEETVSPGTGHLFFTVYDCDFGRVAGVTLKSDTVTSDTTEVYISEGGLPSATLPSTTERGEGALINLPPGFVTITATSDEVGKFFEQTVLIQADSITGVPISPSP